MKLTLAATLLVVLAPACTDSEVKGTTAPAGTPGPLTGVLTGHVLYPDWVKDREPLPAITLVALFDVTRLDGANEVLERFPHRVVAVGELHMNGDEADPPVPYTIHYDPKDIRLGREYVVAVHYEWHSEPILLLAGYGHYIGNIALGLRRVRPPRVLTGDHPLNHVDVLIDVRRWES